MTKKDDDKLLKQADDYSQEVEGALNQMLEDTIRQSAVPNALVWIGTVGGAFLLNLLLLLLVSAG
jgi:hypothetical protein